MKRLFTPLFISICFVLCSCASAVVNKLDLDSDTPVVEKLPVTEKEVYFLGMAHLAKKEFYENTKKIVENLQSEGFVFYVESVKEFPNENAVVDTLSMKKFRKLTNLDVGLKYSESKNVLLQKIKNKYNLVDQPRYELLGIKNFKRVDYNYTQLVAFYENKYSMIKLDSCDVRADIGKLYGCKPLNASQRINFTNEIIFNKRNDLIVDSILNSADKKIVVIYGKKHLEGVRYQLTQKKK